MCYDTPAITVLLCSLFSRNGACRYSTVFIGLYCLQHIHCIACYCLCVKLGLHYSISHLALLFCMRVLLYSYDCVTHGLYILKFIIIVTDAICSTSVGFSSVCHYTVQMLLREMERDNYSWFNVVVYEVMSDVCFWC